MLSAQGRCFTFDAAADGYARGEGCGAVVLRLPHDAAADGQASYERCGLLGVAVNQDGRSSTLTAPNGPSQAAVMRVALAEAKLAPEDVVHMECHGTGTPLGDPIEIGGLKSINLLRPEEKPLLLAAVKSNCGHLEGPAASTGDLRRVMPWYTDIYIWNSNVATVYGMLSSYRSFNHLNLLLLGLKEMRSQSARDMDGLS